MTKYAGLVVIFVGALAFSSGCAARTTGSLAPAEILDRVQQIDVSAGPWHFAPTGGLAPPHAWITTGGQGVQCGGSRGCAASHLLARRAGQSR